MPEINQTTTHEIRQHAQAKKIVTLLASGKTYNQIASEMDVHRDTLYAIINREDMKPLIVSEITGMETEAQRMIRELDASPVSSNKRHALSELGKMIRHTKDKIYPTIFRSENININVNADYEKLQIQQQAIYRALSEIAPTCRDAFNERYTAAIKEFTP